ncbi:Calcium-dependent protein kinase 19 [Hondaea fermentalgiana]|uniref:Calcium-dependent protein kinase 19 n=1 Tax=Hondaea fermentalgiana TaxID=2315210 RepID=A0A2R5G7K2_9STRA|nr:Calcium-dependent protein kinase 19 [Hondaea fermentalgiana]|eukprot:GBG26309.1 Calcium-dependent protein kinase 19 [Hondaea fermentalgiana]
MGGTASVAKKTTVAQTHSLERVVRSNSHPEVGSVEYNQKPRKVAYEAQSALEQRVVKTLKEKNKERMQAGRTHNSCVNRVLLNFPKMQKTFRELHRLYDETDTDQSGSLEFNEVEILMHKLNPGISKEVIKEIFVDADVSKDGSVQFKELICCIGLAYILDLIPELADDAEVKSASKIFADTKGVRRVFELATEMFLAFDVSCSGVISYHDMQEALNQSTGEAEMTKDTRASNQRRRDSQARRNSVDPAQLLLAAQKRSGSRRGSFAGLFNKQGSKDKNLLQFDQMVRTSSSGRNMAVHEWKNNKELSESGEIDIESGEVKNPANAPGSGRSAHSGEQEKPVAGPQKVRKTIVRKESTHDELISGFMSAERWKELDLDGSGEITFMEFLVTFVKWVSSLSGDDEDEDDE